MALALAPIWGFSPIGTYRPAYVAFQQSRVAKAPLLPAFAESGTGGVRSEAFYRERLGYQLFEFIEAAKQEQSKQNAPFAELMQ